MAGRIWLIAGPTASGKSALALRLAKTVGAEIVNADDISSSPTLLSVAVAVSALCALVLGLTAAVRGRRRDLALLKNFLEAY